MSTLQRHPNKLADRTVMLIAGTGSIGMAIASALLARGSKVILTSTRQTKLDEKIQQLRTLYSELPDSHVTGYTLDLGSPTVEDNIKATVVALNNDKVTKIDHLIYLAGDPLPQYQIADIELASWLRASQVRTISFVLCIKHLLPFLQAAGPASVEHSTSITWTGGSVGDKPIPGGWTLIGMIAGAIQAGTRQLALDLKPLRVNCVAPGVIDTDLWNGIGDEAKIKFFEDTASGMPTGRIGHVRDVAEAYMYVMCDGNVTGETIRTNSGCFLV